MAKPFLFRCPIRGAVVQGVLEGNEPAAERGRRFYTMTACPACGGFHMVNPATGKLMSEEAISEAIETA